MSEHKKKKIQFTDTDIRHAQLKIRLERENITQADFFRACISGMSDNDKDLMKFIRRYKEEQNIGRKRDLKITQQEDEQADDLMAKFGIKDDELESIFDLIAEEHPELWFLCFCDLFIEKIIYLKEILSYAQKIIIRSPS